MKNSRLMMCVMPLFMLAALPGCMTLGESPNLLTTEEERRLGGELAKEVEKEHAVHGDLAMQAYIAEIGARLARHAPRQDVEYRFTVIDEPDTVNAFALPGGHMYIYTGLMKLCENEAQLASVMAHEIAHVAAFHHGESLTRMYGLNMLLSAILGDDPRRSAQLIAQIAATATAMRYSREHEREADRLGMEMLFRAGYQPDAMVVFMERMMAAAGPGEPPRYLTFLSSHPPTTERVHNLRAQLSRYPAELRRDSPVYADRYRTEVLNKLN